MKTNITRRNVKKLCARSERLTHFSYGGWQMAGNKIWSAQAYRIDDDTVVVRTAIDDKLEEFGVLDNASWEQVHDEMRPYSDFGSMLDLRDGMHKHAQDGDFTPPAQHADGY